MHFGNAVCGKVKGEQCNLLLLSTNYSVVVGVVDVR